MPKRPALDTEAQWADGRRYLGPEVRGRARLGLVPANVEEVTPKTTRRSKVLNA